MKIKDVMNYSKCKPRVSAHNSQRYLKYLIVLLPLVVIVFIYIMFKRDRDIKKAIISSFLLLAVVALAIMGNIMRSIPPLFLTHIVAVIVAYGATIYYVLREKFILLALVAPLATMLFYLFLVWVGNEHLPSF